MRKSLVVIGVITSLVLLNIGLLVYLYQITRPTPYMDYSPKKNYAAHYFEMDVLYKILHLDTTDILFMGDSYVDHFPANDLLANCNIKNWGLKGEFTAGVLDMLPFIVPQKPKQLFFYIGINDITNGIPLDTIRSHYQQIISYAKKGVVSKNIFLISLLPLRNDSDYCTHCNSMVEEVNAMLALLCKENGVQFIDIYADFIGKGGVNQSYIISDGFHLNGQGYLLFAKLLNPYIAK